MLTTIWLKVLFFHALFYSPVHFCVLVTCHVSYFCTISTCIHFLLRPCIWHGVVHGFPQELPWMPGTVAANWLRGSGPYLRADMKLPGWWRAWWSGPAPTSTMTHTGKLQPFICTLACGLAITLTPIHEEVVHSITALQPFQKLRSVVGVWVGLGDFLERIK